MDVDQPLHIKQTVERILQYDEKYQEFVLRSLLEKRLAEAQKENADITLLNDYTDEAIKQYESFNTMSGISTGYEQLDRLTKGFRKGEIIVLSAKTSVGKTSLALNVSANIAKSGIPVLFVTLEMTHVEIAKRYIHITGGLKDGRPSEDYYKIGSLTVLQKQEKLSWRSIDGLIKKAKEEMGARLVVIDHLHYFSREVQNANEEMGVITKEFKSAAIKYDIPILLIAHTRKTTKGEHVQIEDIRGSSYITQDADIVLMMNRDSEQPDKVHLKIQKNRNAGIDWNNNDMVFTMDGTKMIEEQKWWT